MTCGGISVWLVGSTPRTVPPPWTSLVVRWFRSPNSRLGSGSLVNATAVATGEETQG